MPEDWSPLMWSVIHAGLRVGAIRASRLSLASALSMPLREIRLLAASASRYSGSLSGPLSSEGFSQPMYSLA